MSVGIGYILPTIGEYTFVEFILVLDIFCQQLGDICQLEGVGLQNMLKKKDAHFSKSTICNPAPKGRTNTP